MALGLGQLPIGDKRGVFALNPLVLVLPDDNQRFVRNEHAELLNPFLRTRTHVSLDFDPEEVRFDVGQIPASRELEVSRLVDVCDVMVVQISTNVCFPSRSHEVSEVRSESALPPSVVDDAFRARLRAILLDFFSGIERSIAVLTYPRLTRLAAIFRSTSLFSHFVVPDATCFGTSCFFGRVESVIRKSRDAFVAVLSAIVRAITDRFPDSRSIFHLSSVALKCCSTTNAHKRSKLGRHVTSRVMCRSGAVCAAPGLFISDGILTHNPMKIMLIRTGG